LIEYPRQKELIEAIQEFLEGVTPRHARSTGLTAKIAQRIEEELKVLRSFNDPNGIYARMPINLNVR
jgi:protease-4